MPPDLIRTRYGKTDVRLIRVIRRPGGHDVRDLSVSILLDGEFTRAHVAGENDAVVPTDTMRNMVYVLAKTHPPADAPSFGDALARQVLDRYPHVARAEITLVEKAWRPADPSAAAQASCFVQADAEARTAAIRATRAEFVVEAGLENLRLMKTAGSAFEGFMKDALTTLPEASERVLATTLSAAWRYREPQPDYERPHAAVRAALIAAFASKDSRSMQASLYAMGEGALAACPAAAEIRLRMPNEHCALFDLSPFGLRNDLEVFVPMDSPHGVAEVTLRA